MTLAVGALRPQCDTPSILTAPDGGRNVAPPSSMRQPLRLVTHPFGRILCGVSGRLRCDTSVRTGTPPAPAGRRLGGTPRATPTARRRPAAQRRPGARRTAATGRADGVGHPSARTAGTRDGYQTAVRAAGFVRRRVRDAWTATTPPSVPMSPESHPCSSGSTEDQVSAGLLGDPASARWSLPRSIATAIAVSASEPGQTCRDVAVASPRPFGAS